MLKKMILFGAILSLMLMAVMPIVSVAETSSSTESEQGSSESNLDSSLIDLSEASTSSSSIEESHSSSIESESTTSQRSEESSENSESESSSETTTESEDDETESVSVNEVSVSTWNEFVKAFKTEEIAKISLTNNIDKNSEESTSVETLIGFYRKNSIEIDGKGKLLNIGNTEALRLGDPGVEKSIQKVSLFKMYDITMNQINKNNIGTIEDRGFISIELAPSAYWRLDLSNFTVLPGAMRAAHAPYSEILLSGDMDIRTWGENFVLGSVKIADDSNYHGEVTNSDRSVFWYEYTVLDENSTGISREFTIGKNAKVFMTNSSKSYIQTYSGIYKKYSTITVGEGSQLDISMKGRTVLFQDWDGPQISKLLIKKGAIVNLETFDTVLPAIDYWGIKENSIIIQKNGSLNIAHKTKSNIYPAHLILMIGSNNSLIAEPGSYINIAGKTTASLINMSYYSNNYIQLDHPAQFNLQNLDKQFAVVSDVALSNEFKINNSNINLWNVGSETEGKPTSTYPKIHSFSIKSKSVEIIEEENSSPLISKEPNKPKYNRISGSNQRPEIEWQPVTDASLSAQVRVVIGYKPSKNIGGAKIPIYASKENPATVSFYDEKSNLLVTTETDDEGYASYQFDFFKEAGTILYASAKHGAWESEKAIPNTVIDVTPPKPAVIQDGLSQPSSIKKLKGTGEPHSIVEVELARESKVVETVVNNQGEWEVKLSLFSLKYGDKLSVSLSDNSGSLKDKLASPPTTNNMRGNRNPKTVQYEYLDAKGEFAFQPATIVEINSGELGFESVPSNLNFGTQVVSNQTKVYQVDLENEKPLIITDTRNSNIGWQLFLSELKPLTLQTTVPENGNPPSLSISYIDGKFHETIVGEAPVLIQSMKEEGTNFNLTENWKSNWSEKQGIVLRVPVEKQLVGTYTGVLQWSLADIPFNE